MKRNHTLDVIKGICIIFVLITHYAWTGEERLKYLFPFWIDMAVPTFMIITGYLYALSYNKSTITTVIEAYKPQNISNKLIRFTIPFSIVYFVQLFLNHFAPNKFFNLVSLPDTTFFTFLVGGLGPGSYYYPIMIQFIFLYPIIYFVIKKYRSFGLIMCLMGNVIYEILQRAYMVGAGNYRILIFRYILLIAFGSYLYQFGDKKIKMRWGVFSVIIGALFLIMNQYGGYTPKIIIHWTRTSWLASLFIMPIIAFIIKNIKVKFSPLEILGKASFNIFLVQMVYFSFLSSYVYKRFPGLWPRLTVSLMFSLTVGVLFYYIETPITKWILKKESKITSKIELVNWSRLTDKWFLKG